MAARCQGLDPLSFIPCRDRCESESRVEAEAQATAGARAAAGSQRALEGGETAVLQHSDAITLSEHALQSFYDSCHAAPVSAGRTQAQASAACFERHSRVETEMAAIRSRATACVTRCRRAPGDGSYCRNGCYHTEAEGLRNQVNTLRRPSSSPSLSRGVAAPAARTPPIAPAPVCTTPYASEGSQIVPCCTFNWGGVLHRGEAFNNFSVARRILEERWNSFPSTVRGARDLCDTHGLVRNWRANRARAHCGNSSAARRSLRQAEVLACVCGNGNASSQGGPLHRGDDDRAACNRISSPILLQNAASGSHRGEVEPHHHSGGHHGKGAN